MIGGKSKYLKRLFRNTALFNLQVSLHTGPHRALLYVPGDDERKLRKAEKLDVDCLILDCEDGVAMNRKDAARETISSILSAPKFNPKTTIGVRLNSVESGCLEADLKLICGGLYYPNDTKVFLPKVDSVKHLEYFGEHLKKSFGARRGMTIDTFIYAESCNAVMNLPDICRSGVELSKKFPFRLAGLIFGSDDFCASLGATRSESSKEVLYARQKIVLVAKAFGIEAVDMVYIDLNNEDGLRKQSVEGSSLGYTGKQVIHPRQVEIVQELFSPSKDKVRWAEDLLVAYHAHQMLGKGAFTFDNKMIDAPTIKQAENILNLLKSVT